MHPRISRDSILLWSTVVLIVGMALLQNKQYPLMMSAALSLVLLVGAYWTLPRYRSVPFFLLLAPSAVVTAIFSGLLLMDGFHWQSLFNAITVVMALGGIVIAWQLPRYELAHARHCNFRLVAASSRDFHPGCPLDRGFSHGETTLDVTR